MRKQGEIRTTVAQKVDRLRGLLKVAASLPKFGVRKQQIDREILSLVSEITALHWVLCETDEFVSDELEKRSFLGDEGK